MKKFLLIVGIVLVVACVVSLLYAALNYYGYRNVVDGSAGLYRRLHQKAVTYFSVGTTLAVIGTICLILQSKM